MTFENLLTSELNHVLVITINRPDKLNALNKQTVEEIGKAISYAKSSQEVKVQPL